MRAKSWMGSLALAAFIRCCVFTVSLACLACGSEPRTSADLRIHLDEPTVVPLSASAPLAVLTTVDGHPDFEFVVDSGAENSCISRRNATRLGLTLRPYSRPGNTSGANGKEVAYSHYAIVHRLELGSLQLENWILLVFENEIAEFRPDCGLMGQDVLGHLAIVVDAERSQIHFLPPGIDQAGISKYLGETKISSGEWVILGQVPYSPIPSLPLELSEDPKVDCDFEIDTGAMNTNLPKATIEALHLEHVGAYEASTIAGPSTGHKYMLRNVSISGMRVTGEIHEGELAHGLLGMDILSHVVFILDAPGKSVWLHQRDKSHSKQ